MLFLILLAIFVVSIISLAGILLLLLKKDLDRFLPFFLSFASGSLLAVAFLDMLPEALTKQNSERIFLMVILGMLLFLIIEKFLYWHHCHQGKKHVHQFTYLNLIGDGIHNFFDGAIIASSFLIDVRLGVLSTLAIMVHEIPQEISDFVILLYGGFKKWKAVMMNVCISLTAFAGALVVYFSTIKIQNLENFLLPLSAGGFLYIASVDLLPELKKEKNLAKSLLQFFFILAGIGTIYFFGLLFH